MDAAYAVACLVVCASAALWILLRRRASAPCVPDGAARVPRVAGGVPFLGHAVAFGTDSRAFLNDCRAKYGTPFEIELVGTRYVILDGTARREFFQAPEEFISMMEGAKITLAAEHTVGLMIFDRPIHIPILKREFSVARLGKYLPRLRGIVSAELDAALGPAASSSPVEVPDVKALAWRCIAACSARSMFGARLGSATELLDIMMSYHLSCATVMQVRPLVPACLLGWFARRAAADRTALARLVHREIGLRKGSAPGPGDADFLTILMGEQDEMGAPLSVEAVSEIVLSLIFASMVTSAGALHHALCDLAGHGQTLVPTAGEKGGARAPLATALRAEAAAAWAAAGDAGISVASLQAMPLMHSFLIESTRLAALPLAHERHALRAGQLGKWTIPAGAMVALSASLASDDASVFPDPGVFNAVRFLNSPVTEPAHDGGGVFSFGIRRHVCPGRHFAFAEVKVCIAELLLRFDIRTVSGAPPAYASDSVFLGRAPERVIFTPVPAE